MINDKAQMTTGGQTKKAETRAKQKMNTSNMKTTTIIKAATRETTGIGGIQERLDCLTC